MTPSDKQYYMRRTTLTKEQLLRNAEAMVALANDQPVQYWSPIIKGWVDCENVCCEFEHRVKPTAEGGPFLHSLKPETMDQAMAHIIVGKEAIQAHLLAHPYKELSAQSVPQISTDPNEY